jgi:hypothetical protein
MSRPMMPRARPSLKSRLGRRCPQARQARRTEGRWQADDDGRIGKRNGTWHWHDARADRPRTRPTRARAARRHRPGRPRGRRTRRLPHARRADPVHHLHRGPRLLDGQGAADDVRVAAGDADPGVRTGRVPGGSRPLAHDPPSRGPRQGARRRTHRRGDPSAVPRRVPDDRARRPDVVVPGRRRRRGGRGDGRDVLAGRHVRHLGREAGGRASDRGRAAVPLAGRDPAGDRVHRPSRRPGDEHLHEPADGRDVRLHAAGVEGHPGPVGAVDPPRGSRRHRGYPSPIQGRRRDGRVRRGVPHRRARRTRGVGPRRRRRRAERRGNAALLAGLLPRHHEAEGGRGRAPRRHRAGARAGRAARPARRAQERDALHPLEGSSRAAHRDPRRRERPAAAGARPRTGRRGSSWHRWRRALAGWSAC